MSDDKDRRYCGKPSCFRLSYGRIRGGMEASRPLCAECLFEAVARFPGRPLMVLSPHGLFSVVETHGVMSRQDTVVRALERTWDQAAAEPPKST